MPRRIHDPRYRVWHNPANASFEDLISVLLSHGRAGVSVYEVGRQVANLAGSVTGLLHLSGESLLQINGLGRARASSLLAAAELARRKDDDSLLLSGEKFSPERIGQWLLNHLSHLAVEEFHLFTFNRNFRLLGHHLLGRGDDAGVEISFRHLVQLSLNDKAGYILVAHNHPEDRAGASHVDIQEMEKLEKLLKPLEMDLMDQYIVGVDGVYSCRSGTILLARNTQKRRLEL